MNREQEAMIAERMAEYKLTMKLKEWHIGRLHVIYRSNLMLGDDYGIVTWGRGWRRTVDFLAGRQMLTIRLEHEW